MIKKIQVIKKNNNFIINEKSFQKLTSKGFGYKINNKFYLDLYEVQYLLEKNKIELIDTKNNKLESKDIMKSPKFNLDEFIVYSDLKKKGYNVKTGFKYGVSFRIYDKGIKPGEDHSLWLIEVINEKDKIKIKELISKNRISHSANKKLILAIIDFESNITYIENSWKRL